MEKVIEFLHRIVHEEEGQDMVEYALILGLISIIAVAAVTTTGTKINTIWENVRDAIPGS
jgi:pilus assembly protein Flp/PilA